MDSPSVELVEYDSFDTMGLNENLLRGVYAVGFERPSKIQSKGIVPMVQGRDLLAQAQSGTGKTGTFVIGSLSRIDPSVPKPQILVLVHVRELAKQIADAASAIGSFMGVKVLCATGGNQLRDDIRSLENGAQFIVGTPGRVYDLINRQVLDRQNIRVLIMDEADQMLEDLFYEQVMAILNMGFPDSTQVALLSATMPTEVVAVAEKILRNPAKILIEDSDQVKLEGINQYVILLEREDWKFECICDLYKNLNITQALIFCNKRQKAEVLAEKMSAQGFPVTCIHGEMDKKERDRRLLDFRQGNSRVLISTDLLARGIDVQQVSLVINYELPASSENYIHRIGRSGRFGRKGTAINLILPEEETARKDLERKYSCFMKELPEDLTRLSM